MLIMSRVSGPWFRAAVLVAASVMIVCGPTSPSAADDGDVVFFVDDFEAPPPGTLPPGWHIVWNGRGDAYQEVSDQESFSGLQSFRLLGRSHWSAVVQRYLDSDATVIGYQFEMLIDGVGSAGQEHPGFFKRGAEGNRWGTYYAAVRFDHGSGSVLAEDGTVLGSWIPHTWYEIRVVLDRTNDTYDVWIDGDVAGAGLPLEAQQPELIDAIALVSGHAGVPVYYDNVTVFVPGDDSDGDGIPDDVDDCPDINPGLIDLNVDGCVDTTFVIADYLVDGVAPLAPDLPPAAVAEVEVAVEVLELSAFGDSLDHMLVAVELLEPEGTQAAADAALITGLSAQTTALLAIDEAAQVLGADHPNVIAAAAIAEIGIGQLEQLLIPQAVASFIDAVTALDDEPRPDILIEVDDRSTVETDWVKHDDTFARWGEQIWIPIRVTNTGNLPLTEVWVRQSYSGFYEDVGNLAVGESVMLNVGSVVDCSTYRPRQFDDDPFEMSSWGAGNSSHGWVGDEATTEVDIIHPRLTVTVDAPDAARPGELVLVRVSVKNTGDVVVRGVLLFMRRPFQFWEDVGDLAPGDVRHFPVHYVVPEGRRQNIRFLALALGGRDHDVGISWETFGRSVIDYGGDRMRIIRGD